MFRDRNFERQAPMSCLLQRVLQLDPMEDQAHLGFHIKRLALSDLGAAI